MPSGVAGYVGTFPVLVSDTVQHPGLRLIYNASGSPVVAVSRPPGPDQSDAWALFLLRQRIHGRAHIAHVSQEARKRLGIFP